MQNPLESLLSRRPWRILPMPSIHIPDLKKKPGHEKCVLEFDSWKTFVFLSNFYISLTPKTILIKMKTNKKTM